MSIFAQAIHMKIAFGLIAILFVAIALQFIGVTGFATAAAPSGGQWQCLNSECARYADVSWEEWAQQNCVNQQTEQGPVVTCPITANGQTVAVPLQSLIDSGSFQPQTCAETACTLEVYVKTPSA